MVNERAVVVFDDQRAVANAGVMLPALLAQRLGIEQLVDETVCLGGRVGAANPGRKVMTMICAMALGADCIEDCDLLRSGQTAAVLGHRVAAPSTLGTFLRALTFGHVRQLDRVLAQCLSRAWAAGAGPGSDRLVVDVDSFVGEVHGYAKQGAGFGYTGRRGYHPILATRADTGEVLHIRARKGSARARPGRRAAGYWRHFAFLTTRTEPIELVEAEHRQHAVVELAIRDLKDQALAHFPSGKFMANAAWTVIAALAHNLLRQTHLLALPGQTIRTARTLRQRLLTIPARLIRTGRITTLRMPARWPWAAEFLAALARLRALPPPA
jgi:hypothetical protein